MISGKKPKLPNRRFFACRFLLALAFIIPLSAMAESGDDWSFEILMARFASVDSVDACFTETKNDPLLKEPMQISGKLKFVAPSLLIKEIINPVKEKFIIDADQIIIERSGKSGRRSIPLLADPRLAAFVESFRATLAGDGETLKKHYNIILRGDMDRWELRLSPKSGSLKDIIKAVILAGSGATIGKIEVIEANGNNSVMNIFASCR